jgi:hypothetical protein
VVVVVVVVVYFGECSLLFSSEPFLLFSKNIKITELHETKFIILPVLCVCDTQNLTLKKELKSLGCLRMGY